MNIYLMENIVNEVIKMSDEQISFLKELGKIQDFVVNVTLSKENEYDGTEAMLKDASYEIIYKCMELIDGYRDKNIKYEIKNLKSNEVINRNIDLHNFCEEYLQF